MFSSQSKYKLFSYSIVFEEIINPFIDLISDFISVDKNSNQGILTAINFETINKSLSEELEKLKIRNKRFENNRKLHCRNGRKMSDELLKEKEDIETNIQRLKGWGYETINDHFFNEVFSPNNLSKYEKTKIVLFDKINGYIVSENENIPDLLVRILSESKLISILLNLANKKSNVSFDKLTNFDNESIYRTNINVEQSLNLICPSINVSYLKESLNKTPVENRDVWVNEKFFGKYILPEKYALSGNTYILQDDEKTSGIIIGNTCFIYKSNPTSLIKEEKLLDYYWCLLKNNIYRIPEPNENPTSSLVKEFNEEARKEEFTSLLSNLRQNLYLEDVEIPNEYKKYFEENFKIKGLKHLSGYELYLPYEAQPESSLIGIYHADKKPSETHYNLVHWISNHKDNNKIYEYLKEEPLSKNKKKIHVLKPEISFYFRHKYFEDFLGSILQETDLKYVSNYKLKYKSTSNEAEFDFIIKTDQKIYIIELKTRLKNEEISKFEKKCEKLMNELPSLQDSFEFLIIGALSDENCKTYKYYIEEGKENHKGYNIIREGVSTIPYWFEYPIESSMKKLTCIAELSYKRLKSIIIEVCK